MIRMDRLSGCAEPNFVSKHCGTQLWMSYGHTIWYTCCQELYHASRSLKRCGLFCDIRGWYLDLKNWNVHLKMCLPCHVISHIEKIPDLGEISILSSFNGGMLRNFKGISHLMGSTVLLRVKSCLCPSPCSSSPLPMQLSWNRYMC